MSRYNYRRRPTREVRVGTTTIGGDNPVRLQSMTNTSTLDIMESARQTLRIAKAGGEIVRLTTQGVKEASVMSSIRSAVRDAGCQVPLVADVHFNPRAAYVAARNCEKVRINPGNFVDAARTFQKLEFTDEEYAEEIERIRGALLPLLEICREHSTALRLGVNHGSLSDRIMSRYGDTPEGMTESVMEFLRICRDEDFHSIVISIKASNTVVMVKTVRLLCETMAAEGMAYPVHLGVTEAGDGEDGRIKSAVGIGTLLEEGIGDTIRVSLSEEPENEIPVAKKLRDYIAMRQGHAHIQEPADVKDGWSRSYAHPMPTEMKWPVMGHDYQSVPSEWIAIDASTAVSLPEGTAPETPIILSSTHINAPAEIASWIDRFVAAGGRNPIVVRLRYDDSDLETLQVKAGADYGFLLINGYGSAILPDIPVLSQAEVANLALGILQAARLRTSRTEYIACPGCGRTLFDLQSTLKEVRQATSHLAGLKIGVMGCIVNGPGEMADADYGYVGAGVGRVSIYKGKELMIKNIPTSEALPALLELIEKDHG